MSAVLRIWAIFVVAIKRLLSQPWLALAIAMGLIASVALVMSIPMYADAVYYRVLLEELTTEAAGSYHPPFAYMFRYVGAHQQRGAVDWDEMQAVDEYLSERGGAELGLPQQLVVRYFRTDNFQIFPQEDVAYAGVRDPLIWSSFAFASDFADHVNILEGSFPADAVPAEESVIEVMVHDDLATELGLQVGEMYIAYARRRTDAGQQTLQIPVRIAGVWREPEEQVGEAENYWFYRPAALRDVMIVSEGTFINRIGPYVDNEVYLGLWYIVMDGTNVGTTDVDGLLFRMRRTEQTASTLLPGTTLDVSPMDALQRYRTNVGRLVFLLYIFDVPIVGLIWAFIVLVVGLSVSQRRNEIAVLRSRGATSIQVVGIAALEGVLLGVLALLIAVPAGVGIAYIIGRARSFLDFTLESALRVDVTPSTIYFGAVAVGLALLAQVVPTIGATRHTIVTYRQERARRLRPPWWQRAWLDVMLLIPAGYGAYVLRTQGSIAMPSETGIAANDPFQNPLLILVPTLGIFALTLFLLRILPLLMSLIAWIASHVGGVGILLATRHLSRTPGFYTAPLILLVLTLSLSTYTATLAQTLDNHLYDQRYYAVGSDMRLAEMGESTEEPEWVQELRGDAGTQEEEGARWLFLPVSEHLKIEGVRAVARVGEYNAFARVGDSSQAATFIAVDYHDFVQVAFWRGDFASTNLGNLMNRLALQRDGVLVDRQFLARNALGVGDTVHVGVNAYSQRTEMDMRILGTFDYFPTWYPGEGDEYQTLFVGDLEYFYEQAGGIFPYDVWVKTTPDADYDQIVEDANSEYSLGVIGSYAALPSIQQEQRRPERQGLFGVLSVGFLAAALLTVLGFLFYAFFSFRRRFIELGVLRAVGLSAGQMTTFLAWELAFLILVGLIAGTAFGALVSNLFIPYLQVGEGAAAQVPPFVVEIYWPAIFRIYILFGLLFVAALGILTALLLRMKIFQAVKLGETV